MSEPAPASPGGPEEKEENDVPAGPAQRPAERPPWPYWDPADAFRGTFLSYYAGRYVTALRTLGLLLYEATPEMPFTRRAEVQLPGVLADLRHLEGCCKSLVQYDREVKLKPREHRLCLFAGELAEALGELAEILEQAVSGGGEEHDAPAEGPVERPAERPAAPRWDRAETFRETFLCRYVDRSRISRLRLIGRLLYEAVEVPAQGRNTWTAPMQLRGALADLRYLEGCCGTLVRYDKEMKLAPREHRLCLFAGELAEALGELIEALAQELAARPSRRLDARKRS